MFEFWFWYVEKYVQKNYLVNKLLLTNGEGGSDLETEDWVVTGHFLSTTNKFKSLKYSLWVGIFKYSEN